MQGMQVQKLERGKKQIHGLEPLEGALVPLISAQRLCSQTSSLQNCKRMNVFVLNQQICGDCCSSHRKLIY